MKKNSVEINLKIIAAVIMTINFFEEFLPIKENEFLEKHYFGFFIKNYEYE
jgi:hypothetical protein